MPPERKLDWSLKPVESTAFDIHVRSNGQFCVVLNHALLRGVTSEMIYWWFQNFANLRVRLLDAPGYGSEKVPAYLLWHPSDHCSASLSGSLGPSRVARAGSKIHIREAMQVNKYGLKYPVDTTLDVFYCAADGWAMGKTIPLFGKVMCLRIHYKDVVENGSVIGVHYHYEVVIGATGQGLLAKALNRRITRDYSPEFFAAWHLHNTIEVGTFENFLPALFAQRADPTALQYKKAMNPIAAGGPAQRAHDRSLFAERKAGYQHAGDPYAYQAPGEKSFL